MASTLDSWPQPDYKDEALSRPPSWLTKCAEALLIILLFGITAMRIRALLSRGAIYFDEAYFLLEAKALKHILIHVHDVLNGNVSIEALKTAMRLEGELFPPSIAKPTFSLILTFFSLLPVPLTTAGSWLSLIAATATGGLLFQCFRRLNLPELTAGALDLCWIASPIVGFYAITNLAHILAAFFLTWALLLIIEGRWNMAGLALGLTLTSHYGMAPGVGLLLLFTAVEMFRDYRVRSEAFPILIRMTFFTALPALVWEFLYRACFYIFGSHFKDMHFMTYFEQVQRQFRLNSGPPMGLKTLHRNVQFFAMLARSQGVFLSLVFLLAAGFLLSKQNSLQRPIRIILWTTLASTAFWFLNPGVLVSRIVLFFLPLWYLILGAALAESTPFWRGKRILMTLILGALLGESSWGSWKMAAPMANPYQEALNYLEQIHYEGPIVDLTNTLIWQLYTGKRMAFHQEDVRTVAEFKTAVRALQRLPEAGHRVAFFTLFDQPAAYFHGDRQRAAFLDPIFARGPAHAWFVPYSTLDLYRYEEEVPLEGEPAKQQYLKLFWITSRDTRGAKGVRP